MKRNTKRMLSMLLALVMLLSAVPFVAAADPAVSISGPTSIWAGANADLELNVPAGYTANSVTWTLPGGGTDSGASLPVLNAAAGTYKADYILTKDADSSTVNGSASHTIAVKTPASNLAISGADTAVVGTAVALTATGKNDSEVQWSVEDSDATISTTGSFKADKAGSYVVKAIAINDPGNDADDVQAVKTITVSASEYVVSVSDKTLDVDDTNVYLTYSIKNNAGTSVTNYSNLKFTSSNTTIVAVNASTGLLTPKKAGTAIITMTVTINGNSYSDTATVKVEDGNGLISLDQDGESTDDDTFELEFSVAGPGKKDDVEWTFEVTVLGAKDSKSSPWFTWVGTKESDKREIDVEEEGPDVEVELKAAKGYGVAMIDAYASWGKGDDEEAKGTFYVGFYDEIDYTLTLKDDVDEFDWDEDNVFKAGKKNTTNLTSLTTVNLADLLDDDTDGYVLLDEGKKAKKNEDVGEITTNSSKAPDYDPDDENEYEMGDLKYLTFEADDEGSFIIEYAQYQKVNRYNDYLLTGEGTIELIVGEGSGSSKGKGDINYDVKNKGDVTLDEDDFEDYWDDYCDDEDITGSNADFGYVIFEYKSSKINGAMYVEDGDKNMKDTYLCHFDYDDDEDDSSKDFDLNEVVYEASSSKTNYIDEIDFVCYSDNGKEEVDGTITFTVGNGEDEKEEENTVTGPMSFTDVKTSDWFYDAVYYVYSNQIMAGTSTTKFDPNTNLSRAMVVTMLYRVEGEPVVTSVSSFSDVKDTASWYYKAVCWAAKNGIVNGVTDTTFSPNTNITREQLAAILYRYAGYKGKSTAATTPLTGYADASTVSTYATTAMKWAVGEGIITGDAGRLQPRGNATRAQAAAMFQRFLAN